MRFFSILNKCLACPIQFKNQLIGYSVLFIIFLTMTFTTSYAAPPQIQLIQSGTHKLDLIRVDDLSQLKLFLQHSQGPYSSFSALRKQLGPCNSISFAMNAGMYHADLSPVGLYIEQGKQLKSLNQSEGAGNFFMQPNGVLMWTKTKANIATTQQYIKANVKADYATQSGPMLVIDGKINASFIADSNSRKIRNGVGIKNNQLYFVISRGRINFYDFAKVFQQDLDVQQALYLDGSISSLYAPAIKRHDQHAVLGPMLAWVNDVQCLNNSNK